MKYRYREPHEMKDSGVEWLGMIPKDWEVKKIKRLVREVKGGVWGEDARKDSNDVPCIRITNFNRTKNIIDIEDLTIRNLDYLKQKDFLLQNGDLLIEKSGGGERQPVGFTCIYNSDLKAIYANFIARVRVKKNIYSPYINFLFSVLYSKKINLRAFNQTTGIQNLSIDKYFDEIVMIPLFSTQQKIADFLDKKCEEFDSVIAKKEMLINKLEEAKKSLISEVVTGKVKVIQKENGEYGIIKREDHEMKDSGVEWLGMIPKEWEVSRLKYHAMVMGGFAFSSNDFEEDGIQIIKISNLYMNELQLDRQPNYISKNSLDKFKNYIVTEGDILISLTGTLGKRDYGYAIFIKTKDIFLLNQRVGKITCKNTLFKEYLITLLHSEEYLNQLYSYPSGTKQANLSNEDVLNPILPIPSKKEQGLLIRYIAVKMNEIEKVNKKLSLQIEKLKLAKQSLISEAVTGKIEIL